VAWVRPLATGRAPQLVTTRYDIAGRWLAGHVIRVCRVNGIVQLILDGELVRAWRQRHTPQ
jgi:hypothetical protein